MTRRRRGTADTEIRLTRAREHRVLEARLRQGMAAQVPAAVPPPPWRDGAAGNDNDNDSGDRTT